MKKLLKGLAIAIVILAVLFLAAGPVVVLATAAEPAPDACKEQGGCVWISRQFVEKTMLEQYERARKEGFLEGQRDVRERDRCRV